MGGLSWVGTGLYSLYGEAGGLFTLNFYKNL